MPRKSGGHKILNRLAHCSLRPASNRSTRRHRHVATTSPMHSMPPPARFYLLPLHRPRLVFPSHPVPERLAQRRRWQLRRQSPHRPVKPVFAVQVPVARPHHPTAQGLVKHVLWGRIAPREAGGGEGAHAGSVRLEQARLHTRSGGAGRVSAV